MFRGTELTPAAPTQPGKFLFSAARAHNRAAVTKLPPEEMPRRIGEIQRRGRSWRRCKPTSQTTPPKLSRSSLAHRLTEQSSGTKNQDHDQHKEGEDVFVFRAEGAVGQKR